MRHLMNHREGAVWEAGADSRHLGPGCFLEKCRRLRGSLFLVGIYRQGRVKTIARM